KEYNEEIATMMRRVARDRFPIWLEELERMTREKRRKYPPEPTMPVRLHAYIFPRAAWCS
ncbi:MAG: hypothetical protein ACRECH_14635, partial [Nitrososphaerales archaeon]